MRIKRSLLAGLICCASAVSSQSFAFTTVYGGPAYDQTTQTGYFYPKFNTSPGSPVTTNISVLSATKYANGEALGTVAFRWDAASATTTELGTLSTSSSGSSDNTSIAVNATGTTVGYSTKYTGYTILGERAVRWDASGTAPTELDNLGTDSSGHTASRAWAINATGTAVGDATKYSGNTNLGARAVRWSASGTLATELDNLGTDGSGNTSASAFAINPAGAAVGAANKYTGGTFLGFRAVRWNASGTAATELGNLGADSSGNTNAVAYAINPAGIALGYANKFSGGTPIGSRAVRWDVSGTATELGNLGTNASGLTNSGAHAVNTAGAAVGYATKYIAGANVGDRAVRWDASGTFATELGNLGTYSSGYASSNAYAINAVGAAVGYADKYSGDILIGQRAVLWNYNALAIDLNTLIDPTSGWTLFQAYGISDTNIAIGVGSFDPDGATGPLAAYGRAFMLDVSSVVPTPGDFNNDHKVDAADYAIWRKTNGTQVGYDAWRSNFGAAVISSAGIGTTQATVPEPSAFVSAALSLAAALLLLRKCRA